MGLPGLLTPLSCSANPTSARLWGSNTCQEALLRKVWRGAAMNSTGCLGSWFLPQPAQACSPCLPSRPQGAERQYQQKTTAQQTPPAHHVEGGRENYVHPTQLCLDLADLTFKTGAPERVQNDAVLLLSDQFLPCSTAGWGNTTPRKTSHYRN